MKRESSLWWWYASPAAKRRAGYYWDEDGGWMTADEVILKHLGPQWAEWMRWAIARAAQVAMRSR